MAPYFRSALIVTAADDLNSVFRDTRENLNDRITVLEKDGLKVTHLEGCKTFKELALCVAFQELAQCVDRAATPPHVYAALERTWRPG